MIVSTLLLIVLKVMMIIGLAMYLLFAIVLFRQEQLMAHVLEAEFEKVLRAASVIHLIASLAVFVLALVLL